MINPLHAAHINPALLLSIQSSFQVTQSARSKLHTGNRHLKGPVPWVLKLDRLRAQNRLLVVEDIVGAFPSEELGSTGVELENPSDFRITLDAGHLHVFFTSTSNTGSAPTFWPVLVGYPNGYSWDVAALWISCIDFQIVYNSVKNQLRSQYIWFCQIYVYINRLAS